MTGGRSGGMHAGMGGMPPGGLFGGMGKRPGSDFLPAVFLAKHTACF